MRVAKEPSVSAGEARRRAAYVRCIASITVLAALWRVLLLVSKWNTQLMLNDSHYYSLQAINNARGRWFKEAAGSVFANWGVLPGAEHPPLTSLLITPASLLPHPQFWQRATITLVGVAVVPVTAVLARRIGGRRVAVIAAGIAAIYPNIWLGDALIMSETLMLALIVGTLIAATTHVERFDCRTAAVLGVAIGMTALARSEILLYAPAFALIGIRSHPWRQWVRRAGVLLAATACTVLPWAAYNTARFERVVVMSTNDGTTLLGANCPATYSGSGLGGWNLTCIGPEADEPLGDASVRSVARRDRALSFAAHHTSQWVSVVPARVLRSADLFGLADLVRSDVGEERPRWGVWAGIASWWLLAPLAMLGVRRVRRGVRYVLLVPVIGVVVVAVVFYGSHRLRAPVEPVVVVGAAVFLAGLPVVKRAIDFWLARSAGQVAGR